MNIKTHENYGAVIIELKGDLTGGPEAGQISDLLHNFLKQKKKNVIIDLTHLKFVNSSGIGILISGYTTMKKGDGTLKLAGLSDKIKGVLAITKLNHIFDTYPSIDDALKDSAKTEAL